MLKTGTMVRLRVTVPGVGRPRGSLGRIVYVQSGRLDARLPGTTLAPTAYLVRWFAGGEFWVTSEEVK